MTKSSEGPRTYSAAEKLEAIKELETNGWVATAAKWGVSKATLHWWRRRHLDGEDLSPKPRGAHSHKKQRKNAKQKPATVVAVPESRRHMIQVLPGRGEAHSAGEELRRLQRENQKLKRVIASLLDDA